MKLFGVVVLERADMPDLELSALTILPPRCEIRPVPFSKDRRKGPAWMCRACGFSTIRDKGPTCRNVQPECPCSEIEIHAKEE